LNFKDSTAQAHELTLDMFGTLDEVRKMATMEHKVHSYDEARIFLKELINKPLINKSGIEATLSNKSVDKILSGKAMNKSFDKEAHFLAIANLKKLFFNTIEPYQFEKNLSKNNEHLKAIRRLYTPMVFNDKVVPVKFTVKEMESKVTGARIYSIEAINADLSKKIGDTLRISP
jgi:hypothetical protein